MGTLLDAIFSGCIPITTAISGVDERVLESIESYLPHEECERLLQAVAEHEARHGLPLVSRAAKPRPLLYQVIDGHAVRAHLPEIADLYARVREVAERRAGRALVPLHDSAADVNVNVTPAGGAYRWHYDRNHVTAILYLNVVSGGEIELYPKHRVLLPRGRLGRWQTAACTASAPSGEARSASRS